MKTSEFLCLECSYRLIRKGIRTCVIEDIPEIAPRVIRYSMESMYLMTQVEN